jgi:hypothetical protein
MAMLRNLGHGLAAGAAGTTGLNAVTYLDMSLRARPASQAPEQAVDDLAKKSGHPVPGDGDERQNRLSGLGALTGIATGVAIGGAVGLLRRPLGRLPGPLAALLVGLGAMAATDVPMGALKLTDPKTWSSADWLSDLIPHLVYGAVTYLTLAATDD